MKKTYFIKIFLCSLVVLAIVSVSFGQKRKTAVQAKPKPVVFAVLNDGTSLEPIAQIDKGKLVATVGGDAEPKALADFAKNYYKPKTTYSLIFAGTTNGTVSVKSSNPKAECGKNIAEISTQASTAKLKGFVMALATNAAVQKTGAGVRRLPTATERAEVETLVRDEFTKQNVSASAVKNLHYHNLTAIDVDNDGKAELVGSFWVENSANERNLLFFIAEKDKSGKYYFGYKDYKKVTPEEVMSGEVKDVDTGTYHELFLDTFDYDGDKNAEIFTSTQGFEGGSFTVYRREGGKWVKAFEGGNYHCAY